MNDINTIVKEYVGEDLASAVDFERDYEMADFKEFFTAKNKDDAIEKGKKIAEKFQLN
jgi:hypothetical protein